MTNINKEITLQVGDQCRVLEDRPYCADLFEGDVVTITNITYYDISVLDDRNIEWHLDESKVEPIGTPFLQVGKKCRVVENRPNKAVLCKDEEVVVSGFSYEYDTVTVIDKQENEWFLDLDKVEPIGANALDEEEAEETSTPKEERVYLAGPISTEGDVVYMMYLAEELRNLGYHVHAPHEDDSINDKTNDPSADDIFANDTDAIDNSDIVVLVESGREQIGTHMEAGKIIERIEQGAPLELVVFTSNYRVEDTQIEDGKASASVNHYALGGYKRAGTWVDGMSTGMLEYMKERKGSQHKRELFESLPLHVQEFNEGDTLIDRNSEEEYVIENIRNNSLGDYSEVILKNVNNGNLTADPAMIVPTYYVKKMEDGLFVDKANEVAYYEEYDCEKEFQNLADEEFGIFEGDTLIKKDDGMKARVLELGEHTLVFEVLNTVREGESWRRIYDEILNDYVKQLEDGRLINYSAEIVYKDNEHAKEDGIHVE